MTKIRLKLGSSQGLNKDRAKLALNPKSTVGRKWAARLHLVPTGNPDMGGMLIMQHFPII